MSNDRPKRDSMSIEEAGYLNEYAWRYNHRADGKAQFETLLLRTAGR